MWNVEERPESEWIKERKRDKKEKMTRQREREEAREEE